MSDLLDAPPADRPAGGPRRLPKPVGLVLVAVVLLGLVGGVVLGGKALIGSFGSVPDYPGQGTGEVVVQVNSGDTASDIAATLLSEDVVKSAKAFTQASAEDERALGIQPGFYALRRQMSGLAALTLLLDPQARLRGRVTIPEGASLSQSLDRIAKGTEVPLADLKAAVANPAALGLPAFAKGNVEGFLFPATYDVEPSSTAVEALTMMVQRWEQAALELDLEERAKALGLTPYQALVVASLVEEETAFPADRPKVARVVYNRLKAGMPLQFDSTVNYTRTEKTLRLTLKDLAVDSAYNTYRVKGLPPTPISSPGADSINAALEPADGDFVYFVAASKDGSSFFTKDYDEFLRAKAKAKRDGVF